MFLDNQKERYWFNENFSNHTSRTGARVAEAGVQLLMGGKERIPWRYVFDHRCSLEVEDPDEIKISESLIFKSFEFRPFAL